MKIKSKKRNLIMILAFSLIIACVSFITLGALGDDKKDSQITINIDSATYDLSNAPNAVLNKPYKVFNASAVDKNGEKIIVYTDVYLYYNTSVQSKVFLQEDGTFIPTVVGDYSICYTAVDSDDNQKTLSYQVRCLEKEPLKIDIEGYANTGDCGRKINVAEPILTNENGDINMSIVARHKDGIIEYKIDNKEMSFIPEVSGNYEITYNVSDYNEQVTTSYMIEIVANDIPLITSDADIPKYLIVGSEYTFDVPTTVHYAYGIRTEMQPIITVMQEHRAPIVLDDNIYTPTSEGNITIKFTARFGSNVVEKSYNTKVVDVGYSRTMTYEKYFNVTDGVSSVATNGIAISTYTDGAKAEFINSLLANNLTLSFILENNMTNYNEVNVYLKGAKNSEEIKVTFKKDVDGLTLVKINDERKGVKIPTKFEGGNIFNLYYDNRTQEIYTENMPKTKVLKTIDGQNFNGFEGDNVYLQVELGGVTNVSALIISKLNNQSFAKGAMNAGPFVVFETYDGGFRQVGDIIKIKKVYVKDVLDSKFEVVYSVKSPSAYVVTTEGIELNAKNAKHNEEYIFIANELGAYNVFIETQDAFSNRTSVSYGIHTVDKQAPEITLGEGEIYCKVNETIEIKDAQINDNGTKYSLRDVFMTKEDVKDDTRTLWAYVCVLTPACRTDKISYIEKPNQEGVYYDKLWYKPDRAGEYFVYYYVYDETGNVAFASYKITVSEGTK